MLHQCFVFLYGFLVVGMGAGLTLSPILEQCHKLPFPIGMVHGECEIFPHELFKGLDRPARPRRDQSRFELGQVKTSDDERREGPKRVIEMETIRGP